jgi:hypothetical protein
MNDQHETERTAALLRTALSAAADVMVVHDAPKPLHVEQVKQVKRAGGWLVPLAAAASVVVIAVAAVIVAHLAGPTGKPVAANVGSSSGRQGASQPAAQSPRPEFYLTATYPATGPNVLQFQVRRTNGGAVTASRTISGANLGWGGYLTAAAGDRAFYIAEYPCTGSTGVPLTTFHRITITSSGRISSMAAVGRPIRGMVTTLAVSPDGSQMAYSALTKVCAGPGLTFPGAGSVSVEDLSTGTVRTWQDDAVPAEIPQAKNVQNMVSRLSWAPDGRTLIVDEGTIPSRYSDLTVFGLDTSGSGGSLQAHAATLLRQNRSCSTCVTTALAGPDGSLIALESHAAGQQSRVLVVRIPAAAGSPRTVLYSEPVDASLEALYTDPSGRWALLWPTTGSSPGFPQLLAGWISDGQLHPLPGLGRVSPQGIAW